MSIEESGVRLRSAGANTDGTVDEVRDLKACVNDLVGILTLPAMWSRSEPNQIVTMLLDVVLRILRLDFVYARLRLGAGAPKETFRFADSCRSSTNEDVLRRALGQWLTHDSDTRTSVLPWPGEETSGLRQADQRLSNTARARLTFSSMSEALAVQTKGLGLSLCLSM